MKMRARANQSCKDSRKKSKARVANLESENKALKEKNASLDTKNEQQSEVIRNLKKILDSHNISYN